MLFRLSYTFVTAIFVSGCTQTVQEPTPTSKTEQSVKNISSSNKNRLSIGSVSFILPKGWEAKKNTQTQPPGYRIFAPERPEWKEIGFRVSLGVNKRPHPGMSLDSFHQALEKILSGTADELNTKLSQLANEEANKKHLPNISIIGKTKYSIVKQKMKGIHILSTTFTGAFILPSGLVQTKTLGLQVLRSDALYSIAITFPIKFEKEMTDTWNSFVKDLRLE